MITSTKFGGWLSGAADASEVSTSERMLMIAIAVHKSRRPLQTI
jgi:hypothetical protein